MAIGLKTGLSPDLASEHATSLLVTVRLPDSAVDALLNQLNLSAVDAPKAVFVSDYRKARKKHQAYGTFEGGPSTGSPLSMYVVYDLAPVPFGEEVRPITELFDALSQLGIQSEAECVANFEYPGVDWESVVTLPWRPLQMPNLPFDEFRGFRAVKTRDGEVLYSLILDRPTNQDITHSITFSFTMRLDANLPLTLLERGREISRLFVLHKPTTEGPGRGSE